MSDYLISVVDATSAFPTPKENREYQTSNLDDAYDKGWDDCQLYIGTLPPIDAVPVVRCKDCKYWHREIYNGIEYFNFSSCDLNHHGDGRNFYCADAEWKEE